MGESWQFVGSGTRARFITNIDTLGGILIASAKSGGRQPYALSFSYDKGATWSENKASWPFMGIEAFTVHGNSIFVKVQQGVLLRSDDTAKTWTSLANNVPGGLFLNVNAFYSYQDTLLAATDGGAMFSANNGLTWIDISSGLPDTATSSIPLSGNPVLSISKNGRIIMAGMRSSLYISEDNGSNWKLLKSLPLDMFVTSIGSVGSGWIFGYQGGGISRYDHANDSWETRQTDADLNYQSVWNFCSAFDQLFIASEAGIYKIANSSQASRKSAGIYAAVVTDFAHNGPDLFAATMGSGVFEKSSAAAWKSLNNNTLKNQLANCLSLFKDDIAVGTMPKYLSEQGGVYLGSYSPGNMLWQPAVAYGDPACTTCIRQVRDLESDTKTLYIGGSGGFFTSSDSGRTIAKVAGSDLITDVNCFYNQTFSDNLMIGGNQGVFKYNTATNTLSGQLLGHLTYAISGNQKSLFAGAWRQGVFRSDDNGETWTKTSLQLPTDVPVVALACSGDSVFAGTDGLGVFFSSDNGETWRESNDGLACPLVKALHLHDGILYAGTNGGGVFEMPMKGSGSRIASRKIVNTPAIEVRPMGNIVEIRIQKNHGRRLRLELMDITGKTMHSLSVLGNQDISLKFPAATNACFVRIRGQGMDYWERVATMQ